MHHPVAFVGLVAGTGQSGIIIGDPDYRGVYFFGALSGSILRSGVFGRTVACADRPRMTHGKA